MADGPQHTVGFRRRREQKTDYKKRLALLKSGKHRTVVRMSNNHARVQIVAYDPDGDRTVTAATSQDLSEHGWDHHTGNIPAAYLTGFLAGKRAQEEGITEAVSDLGVYKPEYGGREYAAVQGLRDAGLTVEADEATFPDAGREAGEHADAHESEGIQEAFETVKEDINGAYGG